MTPTQQRIHDLLSDGLPHTRQEVHRCLYDNLSDLETIQVHISHLRRAIHPRGLDILCVTGNGTLRYQMVRLLASPNE